MPKGYHHLTHAQRSQIQILKKIGKSQSSIAQEIKVDQSAISRELKRNSGLAGYQHKEAEAKSRASRVAASSRPKKLTPECLLLIEKGLKRQWSPEQIAGRLKLENPENYVSHHTIYRYVWKDKKQGGKLYENLRHRGKKYRKSRQQGAGKSLIPNRIDIEHRPKIVEQKDRLGDWEIDTVIGTIGGEVIVSMVERATKFTKLAVSKNKTAKAVANSLIRALKPLKEHVLSMTSDNGTEFVLHEQVSKTIGADFYFAKPYHSWERGLNEHTNGLLRQYLPKRTSFAFLKPKTIAILEHLLNNRPRKELNFATPQEAFNHLKGQTYALRC